MSRGWHSNPTKYFRLLLLSSQMKLMERVEKALGRGILFRIPNSYNEVIRAINAGAPISSATKSDFAAAIHSWAHDVATSKESAKKFEKMKALATAQSRGGVLGLFGR